VRSVTARAYRACSTPRTMLERYTSSMGKAPHGEAPLEVGVRELRDHLSRWLDEVKAGSELVITERGRPVARLVPAAGPTSLDDLIAAGIVSPPRKRREPASTFGRVKAHGDVLEFVLRQRR
jgi:prevent-host-death family protein